MNSRKQALIFSTGSFGKSQSDRNEKETNSTSHDSEVLLSEGIEDFLLMGKVDGRTEKTLNLYDYVFDNFLQNYDEDVLIGDLEPKDIRKYLSSLMEEGLKNTTVAIHHRVLNAFFNWLVEEGKLAESPTVRIDEPSTPDKFPKILNQEQIEELLNNANNWRKTWLATFSGSLSSTKKEIAIMIFKIT